MEFNSRIKFNKYLYVFLSICGFVLMLIFFGINEVKAKFEICTENGQSGKCVTNIECDSVHGDSQLNLQPKADLCSTDSPYCCKFGVGKECTLRGGECISGTSCPSGQDLGINVTGLCDTSKICCKKVAAATPAAGATCTSKATAAIPAKTGKCQAAACTGDTKIEADPKCSDAKTPNCCATAAAPKATCKDAGGTCKAKESSGKCPGEETEVTDLKTKCDKPNGGGDTTKNTCCKAASATAGDQSGAAGGTAGAGTDPFSRIFNVFIACLTFSISLIIHLAAWLAGQIVVLLMEILVFISGYNSFIRNSYVSEGWRILRDLVNMFFVLGMLFIAFATVLKIEKYSWNKLLGKLLMMAVLVNFSKTICGVIIDFFQVLLMTFANAYKDITAGNIFSGLGMVDWFKVQSQAVAGNVAAGVQLGMIASAFLGLILAIVSMIVIFIFCVILIVRIVGLWVLVTFSPLAFFAYTFEGTKGLGTISSTWWKEFLEYCMVGPFVGFILWISVATLPKLDVNQMIPGNWYDTSKREGLQVTFSEAGSMDRILKYMMSIVTMVVGLGYAKKFSIIGASALSGVAEKFKDQTVGRAQRFGKSAGETISAPVRGAMKGVGDAMRGNRYMRYMTTEGRKEAAQLSEAKARGAFGPRSGEQERMMRQITEGDVKRLDSERAFINPNAFKGKLKEAFDKGDYRNARALMNEGAKKGWIGTDDVDKFKDQFRPKMGEKAHFEFTEQLGKDFKEATGRHLRTNDEYISPEGKVLAKTDTAEKEYKDAVGRMSASQQSDMAENKKVFKNEDGNNKYWKEDIMAFTGNEMNAGRWTQKARNNIRDGIDEIRKDPNKMKEFNKEQLQDMNVLYEAATAEYEGLNRAKDADGNKSKGKVAFDHGSLRIDKDRGINLAAKDGYESADIAGAPRISDDDINNLKQKEKEEENKTPKVTGAPPAPRSSILSGLAKSKYFGKEGEDAVLAWKGKPVTRAAEAGANYARRAYKFMTNVGGKRGDVGYVPPKAKELGGAENLSAADIKVIIDQEKEMGKDLSFGANNVRMTDNGDFLASERTKILADIQQKLQAKGLGADVAANKAGQIVRNREDQFRHQQASREVHLKVLQNIEMEGTNTPTKLVGLESVQDETAAGAIDSKSIEQAIFDVTSRFNKYVKQLGKSGADIDQNGVAGMQQELDKLTNYARTRKDLSSKEKLDAINNINVTVKVMKDGILVEGVPEK